MKQCSKCKKWKEFDCFGKRKASKDGYVFQCKECIKEYYKLNKSEIKKYCKINKDKIEKRRKKYYDMGQYC